MDAHLPGRKKGGKEKEMVRFSMPAALRKKTSWRSRSPADVHEMSITWSEGCGTEEDALETVRGNGAWRRSMDLTE